MDTDRDRDIALLEVQDENRKLVEEFYREKLGKRGMQNAEQASGTASNETSLAPGAPAPI